MNTERLEKSLTKIAAWLNTARNKCVGASNKMGSKRYAKETLERAKQQGDLSFIPRGYANSSFTVGEMANILQQLPQDQTVWISWVDETYNVHRTGLGWIGYTHEAMFGSETPVHMVRVCSLSPDAIERNRRYAKEHPIRMVT